MKGKPITIYDVAKQAGVSPATVSRALNNSGYVSSKTASKVRKVAEELGYVPNSLAEGLRGKRTGVVGLIIPDITNPFWPDVVRGAEDKLRENDYQLIVVNTDGDLERERAALKLLHRRQVDGVLVAAIELTVADIDWLVESDVPMVIIGKGIDDPRIDAVYTDSFKGAYLACEHLLRLGHERIAFVGSQSSQVSFHDRYRGYVAAHASYGKEPHPDLVIRGESLRTGVDSELLRACLARDDRPTALFAMQDTLAMQCWEVAESLGLSVPEDLSIVGFDDIPFARFFRSGLTTVRQLRYERGHTAAQVLLEGMESGGYRTKASRILLEPTLVVRGSTRSVE